jgi:hypothetical protein
VHIYVEISLADDVDEDILFCVSQLKLKNIASARNTAPSVVKAGRV